MEKLKCKGTKTKLSLTTLQGENEPIECPLVSLEASDLSEDNTVQLPQVYSRPSLPIPPEAIARQEDVDRWPYLKGVNISHIDADIGLLIGSDVPEVLQPMEIRPSENGGPFATCTVLGWVLNGPLGRAATTQVSTANFVQGNKTLDEQFHEFCNLEFSDTFYDSKTSVSLNDHRALNIMEETVKPENGHYEMALPWKFYPPRLQNNRTLAERRLLQLKKRLLREPLVHQKYKEFMDDLLSKDNARKVNRQTIETVKRNFYVDDCFKSVGSDDNAIRLARQLRELLARGGFKLTKWLSNSRKVIESLPESERAAQVKTIDFDKLPVERALGVQWNVSSDQFGW